MIKYLITFTLLFVGTSGFTKSEGEDSKKADSNQSKPNQKTSPESKFNSADPAVNYPEGTRIPGQGASIDYVPNTEVPYDGDKPKAGTKPQPVEMALCCGAHRDQSGILDKTNPESAAPKAETGNGDR